MDYPIKVGKLSEEELEAFYKIHRKKISLDLMMEQLQIGYEKYAAQNDDWWMSLRGRFTIDFKDILDMTPDGTILIIGRAEAESNDNNGH
jgi:hypothetical protein